MRKIIIISLGIVFALQSCSPKNESEKVVTDHTETKTTAASSEATKALSGKIGYIDVGRVNEEYLRVMDLGSKMETMTKEADNAIMNKLKAGEAWAKSKMGNYNKMFQDEKAKFEQDYQKKQAEIEQFRQMKAQGLLQFRESENEITYNIVQKFIKGYAEANDFDLIIDVAPGSIFYGKTQMDLTEEVLIGLNEEYATPTTIENNVTDSTTVIE